MLHYSDIFLWWCYWIYNFIFMCAIYKKYVYCHFRLQPCIYIKTLIEV